MELHWIESSFPTVTSPLTLKARTKLLVIQKDGMILHKGRAIGRDAEILHGLRTFLKLPHMER